MDYNKLMPFRLPSNWAVCYNSFGDEDMIVEDNGIANFQSYKEDLLWIQSMRTPEAKGGSLELDPAGWLADVGWYPSGDPTGNYVLHIFRLNPDEAHWPSNPPRFCSQNRYHICLALEYVIHNIQQTTGDTSENVRQQFVKLQYLEDTGELADSLER
ncbi:hypothetical protein H8B15_10615 [Hymenobacter sp. BT507]|uniref:Uncharacterized protein n=1 Tax=Hymenobacter citatus TaxID=2763506 RepID=A0ABR7MJY1_9BACT|nr:hypothetical protein [Hymenobacter citatus]MBC6611378.1 hypothetical protein [Hymenobacter citatus]